MDNLVEKFNISMTPFLSQSVAWMMSYAYNVDQNIILHCLVNTFDFFIDISANFNGSRKFIGQSFYTCFDWFKKLRLFVNERNLKIEVVLKASRVVVLR
jgi:hypothetical protein